jgi:hypothetical protein
MMLRNLLEEIVRRRLWPVPVAALLVAVAAPVLFLKPSPTGAPAADTQAPAPAAVSKLPARAERLLAATSTTASRGRAGGAARDPFAPPSGHGASAKKTASGSGKATSTAKADSKAAASFGGGSSSSGGASSTTAPATTTPAAPSGGTADTAPAVTIDNASVDIRFGARAGGRVHRSIPRLQPYYIHGKLVAVFVKYSPSRRKAVFAIAPGLSIKGPVKCRRHDGVCRYLDIPVGSYARLTMVTSDRIAVTRRLDVERIRARGTGSATTATVASDRSTNACLLDKLRVLKVGAPLIDRDACG